MPKQPFSVSKAPEARLAAFVVDRQTGGPLANVPIVAEMEVAPDRKISLGILTSDRAGYVSFDLTRLGDTAKLGKLWLFQFGHDQDRVQGFPSVTGRDAPYVTFVNADKPIAKTMAGFGSIQRPGPLDKQISPASFATKKDLILGAGGCEQIVHRDEAVQEVRLVQVGRSMEEPTRLMPAAPSECDQHAEPARPLCVRKGWVNEYRVSTYHKGHSLGELIYSLPLAPCESVNLAVVEWSRHDTARRDEETGLREGLSEEMRRDRSISETIEASLEEWQGGGSIMGGGAGSYGASSGMSLSGALGFAYSTSGGDRSVEADTLQQLSDRIVQTATAVRRLRSTVVVAALQRESESVSTRTITNHNHCHALTVLYYEVLRHFHIVTEWIGRENALLIQYPVYKFTEDFVLGHQRVLRRALREPRLLTGFKALEKKSSIDRGLVPTDDPLAVPGGDRFVDNVTIVFKMGDYEGGTFQVKLVTTSGADITLREFKFKMLQGELQGEWLTWIPVPDPGKAELHVLQPETAVRWSDLESIQILNSGERWTVRHFYAAISNENRTWVLCDTDLDKTIDEDDDPIPIEIEPMPGATSAFSLLPQERVLVEALLTHLRAESVYYSRAIWLAEDADQRAMRFDAIRYDEGRLLDYIENRVLAVLGDYVAFPRRPMKGDEVIDPTTIPPPEERDLVLPTAGVFAEAELSHCNACEERDITRFWDWSESPCPDKAPAIAPVATGSRAQQPQGLQPTAFPAPIVNIVNPPAAPDPTAMAAAMSLLATPNIFRDMSGIQELSALLQKLVGSATSLEQASNTQGQGQGSGGGSTPGGGGGSTGGGQGGGAGAGGGRERTPQQQHEMLNVLRNARDHGEISEEQEQQYANDIVNPQGGGSDEPTFQLVNYTESDVESLLGLTGPSLSGAASRISRDAVIDHLRGPFVDDVQGRQTNLGSYFRFNIPDRAEGHSYTDTSSWTSWRSWEAGGDRPTAAVGGGWPYKPETRWYDFWRVSIDRAAPPDGRPPANPLVFRLILALQQGSNAEVVAQQLARLHDPSLVRHQEVIDVALTLAVTYRESTGNMFTHANVSTVYNSGIDSLRRPFVYSELKGEHYLRRNFPVGAATLVDPREVEGQQAFDAQIRGDLLTEAVGALLNRTDDLLQALTHTIGFDWSSCSLAAKRIWKSAFFFVPENTEAALRQLKLSSSNLDDVIRNVDLQNSSLMIKRGHISAAEAEVLDHLLLPVAHEFSQIDRIHWGDAPLNA